MLPIKQLLAATIAAAALQPALAEEEKPPPGAMALSTVLTKLEQQGYTPIIGVLLENGRWEVEAYKGAEKRELEVDPNTAEILADEPDDD